MPKPTQPRMFTTQDLPLFSHTAPRATDSVFTEQEPEPKQLSLPAPDTCNHPAHRLYTGWYYDPALDKDVLWITCCNCGSVLK